MHIGRRVEPPNAAAAVATDECGVARCIATGCAGRYLGQRRKVRQVLYQMENSLTAHRHEQGNGEGRRQDRHIEERRIQQGTCLIRPVHSAEGCLLYDCECVSTFTALGPR